MRLFEYIMSVCVLGVLAVTLGTLTDIKVFDVAFSGEGRQTRLEESDKLKRQIALVQRQLGLSPDGVIRANTCDSYREFGSEELIKIFYGTNQSLKHGMTLVDTECNKRLSKVTESSKKSKWLTCRTAIKKAFGKARIRKPGMGTDLMFYDGQRFEAIVNVTGRNVLNAKTTNGVRCTIENGRVIIDNGIEELRYVEEQD